MKNTTITVKVLISVFLGVSCSDWGGGVKQDAEPYPDDIGAMVDVPAGEFMRGCNGEKEMQCFPEEEPYHAVMLSAYKIGKYEVTTGEYQACVQAGACNNDKNIEPQYRTFSDNPYCHLGAKDKKYYPMQCVTWYGAKAYCEWIGGRLPTEAEWEKAARGTDGRKYPWGDEAISCDYAVIEYDADGSADCEDRDVPPGSRAEGISPYNTYDMIGNVEEWANDWYGDRYYEESPSNDPSGPGAGTDRVVRGGHSYNWETYARSNGHPYWHTESRGFRCVK